MAELEIRHWKGAIAWAGIIIYALGMIFHAGMEAQKVDDIQRDVQQIKGLLLGARRDTRQRERERNTRSRGQI